MKRLILIAAGCAFLAAPGLAAAQPGHGKPPPGLAKKPHGMPPGQAKKMWARGEHLPRSYYTESRYYVTNPRAFMLPPAPYGSRWVRVGDAYYLTRTDTGVIMDLVSALAR